MVNKRSHIYFRVTIRVRVRNRVSKFFFTFSRCQDSKSSLIPVQESARLGWVGCNLFLLLVRVLKHVVTRTETAVRIVVRSIMIPLVKNKCGDISDLNNYMYRAISVSPVLSKVLESVLYVHLQTDSDVDCYQFGFKPGHSTSLCILKLWKRQ